LFGGSDRSKPPFGKRKTDTKGGKVGPGLTILKTKKNWVRGKLIWNLGRRATKTQGGGNRSIGKEGRGGEKQKNPRGVQGGEKSEQSCRKGLEKK